MHQKTDPIRQVQRDLVQRYGCVFPFLDPSTAKGSEEDCSSRLFQDRPGKDKGRRLGGTRVAGRHDIMEGWSKLSSSCFNHCSADVDAHF